MVISIPLPAISYRYRVHIDNMSKIASHTMTAELDLVSNEINLVLMHSVDPDGSELISEISKLKKRTIIELHSLDGDGETVGMISRKCILVKHSMKFDYSSSQSVVHYLTLNFNK